jgi:hypothetical protein
MLKRILFLLMVPGMMGGCVVREHRPAVVGARYVPRCPVGYRYDGYDCHRVARDPEVEVQIRPR